MESDRDSTMEELDNIPIFIPIALIQAQADVYFAIGHRLGIEPLWKYLTAQRVMGTILRQELWGEEGEGALAHALRQGTTTNTEREQIDLCLNCGTRYTDTVSGRLRSVCPKCIASYNPMRFPRTDKLLSAISTNTGWWPVAVLQMYIAFLTNNPQFIISAQPEYRP